MDFIGDSLSASCVCSPILIQSVWPLPLLEPFRFGMKSSAEGAHVKHTIAVALCHPLQRKSQLLRFNLFVKSIL